MLDLGLWVLFGFLCGSIPWSLLITKIVTGKDVRSTGDGNPGTVNAWKIGGWIPGSISLVLDVGKGIFPIQLATSQMNGALGDAIFDVGIAFIALAPIVGHAWSPFLMFKGGKALAVSWGAWIAITKGLVIPVSFLLLGFMHALQKNHAITVTFSLITLIAIIFPFYPKLFIVLLWLGNCSVLIYKHKDEYSEGIVLRQWVYIIRSRLT